ncbi:MAG TPA: hypothetical protein VJN88_16745, partial [Ktedonobacterales bacterium]|nr:hypothetical protein [Ktedonobacterales bacterium]
MMAVQPKRDAEIEALIRQAAAEIQTLNPLIGKPTTSVRDDADEEWLRDKREIETIWAEIARQQGNPVDTHTEPAADAVN